MKKLLLLLLTITLSCSNDEEQSGSLQIPDRFVGDWVSGNTLAKVRTNRLEIDFEYEPTIVRTEGTTTVDNGATHFEAELPNNERLVLLFRENDEDTPDDDVIGITLFGEKETITSDFYFRE